MPRKGYRQDKQGKFVHVDKPLALQGASWIEPMGSTVLWEDFLVDVLADTPWTSVIQAGTPTTAGIITLTGGGTVSAGQGGWVGGATSAAAGSLNDELSFGGLSTAANGANWRPERSGNGMMVMEIGFVIPSALTARQYYVGWADDPTDGSTNGALNIQTAYTIVDVNTDAAGWIFSSLATAPTIWKYGSTLSGAESTCSAATEGVTGVVDAYTVCRVEIDAAGDAFFFQSTSGSTAIGRQEPVMIGAINLAVTPTIGLLPKFEAASTTTTAVQWEVDYCFAAQAR